MINVLIRDKDAAVYRRAIEEAFPDFRVAAAKDEAEAIAIGGDAEVLVSLAPDIKLALIAALPKLVWIHALTTGVDNLLAMDVLPREVVLTASRGIHGPQMSELAILLMLALARDLPQMLRNQQTSSWQRWPQPLLEGRTACLVGLGSIAEVLAARCAAFGMSVTGVSDGRDTVPGFTRVYPRAALADAAAEADFLVLLLPYTAQTHHIVDAQVIGAMKPSAYLVNISRGGCVDEAALTKALMSNAIAGAGLDVFETEPLSPDSPLWGLSNVIVTPHIGGNSDVYCHQALPGVIENLRAYATGGTAALEHKVKRP